MSIIGDIISSLDTEATIQDVRLGIFCTGVLSRNCGLASTMFGGSHQHGHPAVKEPGSMHGKPALELAQMAHSTDILEAAMGLATINSLLDIDEERCQELNAGNLIAALGEGKKVAIVGHFPFVQSLKGIVKELWVIERNPTEGDYAESEAENLIPQADVVGITSSAITNHSIEQLLALCHPRSYVITLGGTTPLSPVLFDYGVNAISGTRVINPELALRCISEGASFRQIQGTHLLTMTSEKTNFKIKQQITRRR